MIIVVDHVAVLMLPAGVGVPQDATVASVLAERVPEHAICSLEHPAALERAELVAFARPGDRVIPGHLRLLRVALEADRDASASVGAHRLVDEQGRALADVHHDGRSPQPLELARHCPLEPSATLARRAVLDDELLARLADPGGYPAFFCGLAERGGIACARDVVAEVLLDPARHGFEPAARISELVALLEAGAPAPQELRRELLRRLYLEGRPVPDWFDVRALTPAGDTDALLADLEWTLARQAEQLALLWQGWPKPEALDLRRLEWPEDKILALRDELSDARTEGARYEAIAGRLQAELVHRDAVILRLRGAAE
jgi:hypothetical protein